MTETTQNDSTTTPRKSGGLSSMLLPELKSLAGQLGIPAVVSGAGPTVLALADATSAPTVAGLAGARFATSVLEVDAEGGRVVPLDG